MTDPNPGSRHPHPVDPVRVAAARARVPAATDVERLVGLLSMLADPVRARIIYALDTVEELCVGDLALALDLPEHTIGYGLRMLRTAGLLAARKSGRMVYYRLTDDFPEPLREHCLRRLIHLSQSTDSNSSQPDD